MLDQAGFNKCVDRTQRDKYFFIIRNSHIKLYLSSAFDTNCDMWCDFKRSSGMGLVVMDKVRQYCSLRHLWIQAFCLVGLGLLGDETNTNLFLRF